MSKDREGKYIVIEGLPGAGKTVLLRWLHNNWPIERNLNVTREPGGTKVGEAIRYAVQSPQIDEARDPIASLFLYSGGRAQSYLGMRNTIKSGSDLLSDRDWASTYAFQGCQGISRFIILGASMVAMRGFLPDRWIYMTGDVDILLRRKYGQKDGEGKDDDIWDKMDGLAEFTRRTDKRYRELGLLFPRRWKTVKADGAFGDKVNQVALILSEIGINLRNIPPIDYDLPT